MGLFILTLPGDGIRQLKSWLCSSWVSQKKGSLVSVIPFECPVPQLMCRCVKGQKDQGRRKVFVKRLVSVMREMSAHFDCAVPAGLPDLPLHWDLSTIHVIYFLWKDNLGEIRYFVHLCEENKCFLGHNLHL